MAIYIKICWEKVLKIVDFEGSHVKKLFFKSLNNIFKIEWKILAKIFYIIQNLKIMW